MYWLFVLKGKLCQMGSDYVEVARFEVWLGVPVVSGGFVFFCFILFFLVAQ